MQVEAADMDAVIKRLQRAQGQIGGIIRMIQEERECRDIITQFAAVSKAIDRAGFAVLSHSLQQCVLQSDGDPSRMDIEDLESLFLSLA